MKKPSLETWIKSDILFLGGTFMSKSRLNLDIVDQFVEAFGSDDPTQILELLSLFRQVSTEEIQKINDFEKSGQWIDISRSAHKMKSSAGNIGAEELYLLCLNLEKNTKLCSSDNMKINQIRRDISFLEDTFQKSIIEIEEYLFEKGIIKGS